MGWPQGPSATSSQGPSPSHRLTKHRARDRRLRRRADFDRVFQQGRHHSGRLIAVRSVPNEQPLTRFAFAISRRVGNAVTRNRVKRRLREILRLNALTEGYDIVIVARPAAAESDFQALNNELTLLLKRAKLLEGAT